MADECRRDLAASFSQHGHAGAWRDTAETPTRVHGVGGTPSLSSLFCEKEGPYACAHSSRALVKLRPHWSCCGQESYLAACVRLDDTESDIAANAHAAFTAASLPELQELARALGGSLLDSDSD